MSSGTLKEKDKIDKKMFIEFGEECANFNSTLHSKVGFETIDLQNFLKLTFK
jgi:hypothetical protein